MRWLSAAWLALVTAFGASLGDAAGLTYKE